MSVLTVDLGNSRCKLRLWGEPGEARPELLGSADVETGPGLAGRVGDFLDSREPPRVAGLVSVAAAQLERELADALAARCSDPLQAPPEPGIAIAALEPETVGIDRVFAARGAVDCVGESAIVVDAGTALTVDAVEVLPEGEPPRFLGGSIAPGPGLLAEALARGGARLPEFEARPGVPALGRHTREALESGVAVGFRGAARELVREVSREAGLEAAPVVVTGGARRFLFDPPVFEGERLVLVEEELVHQGLYAALMGEVCGAPGPWRIT